MDNHKSDNSRRVGISMVALAWVLLLGLLFWWFTNYEESRRNPNQNINLHLTDEGTKEIVLQRNRYGHYVATGTINEKPVTFLLDTGATDVSVPEELANQLGLKRGIRQTYNTANGKIFAYQTKLDRVNLGGIELHNIRASINPSEQGNEVLLGMSFLKELEFTQRGDTLTIRTTR